MKPPTTEIWSSASTKLQQRAFEHKLTVFDQALEAAGDVVIAPPAGFQKKLDRFKVIKHGEARMLGDFDISNAMIKFYNKGFDVAAAHKERDQAARNDLDNEFVKLSDVFSAKIKADMQAFAPAGP